MLWIAGCQQHDTEYKDIYKQNTQTIKTRQVCQKKASTSKHFTTNHPIIVLFTFAQHIYGSLLGRQQEIKLFENCWFRLDPI